MLKLVNRAKMTVASGGAGDITLGTAVAGYQTFADAGISDTDILRYTIEDGDDWEIGTGVYTASGTTLVRTVTESSNSDAALTCSADAVIFVTLTAEDFSGNAAPIWTTTPPSSLDLAVDGTAVTIAGVAIDEFPIQYSWDGYSGTTLYNASSLPPQLASAPTFSGGTASLVGSSTRSNAGSFNFRLKASDGVKTATATTAVLLTFDPDLANATYDSVSLSVALRDTYVTDLAFSATGDKMYVLGKTNNSVYEYDLSTSWDLSTAQYNNVSFSIASQEGNAFGLAFSSTGDKMYVIGLNNDRIHEYDLSTNWDVSTAQYNNVRFSVTLQEGTPEGIAFSSTGDKMYVVGSTSDSVYEYDLSTNWDLSSASYNNVSLSVASQETTPTGLAFTSTGNKIYVIGATSDSVYEYDLSTNWDLSSASYNNVSFRVASQNGSPEGVAFSSIGDKMYMIGFSGGTIFQYSV